MWWQIASSILNKNNSPAWNKLKGAISLARTANSAHQQEQNKETENGMV